MVATVQTQEFRSNAPYPDILDRFSEKLKVEVNGSITVAADRKKAAKEQLVEVPAWNLYEFLVQDSAKAFLCKRLHKYKGFSLEYSELKGVDATTKLPFTEYKVRLAGVAELAPKAPMTKISRSFSRISVEHAMLKMALYYQMQIDQYDLVNWQPGFEEVLAVLSAHHDKPVIIPAIQDAMKVEMPEQPPIVQNHEQGSEAPSILEEPPVLEEPLDLEVPPFLEEPPVLDGPSVLEAPAVLGAPVLEAPPQECLTVDSGGSEAAIESSLPMGLIDPALLDYVPMDMGFTEPSGNANNVPEANQAPEATHDGFLPDAGRESYFEEAFDAYLRSRD